MNVVDAIKNRRSIRKYKQKEVSQDLINELIEAARLAPSGNNSQPWMFKIINSKKEIDLLKENKVFMQNFVYTAPVLILCLADPDKFPYESDQENFYESNKLRAIRDLSIATQNLVLRATELGLGTCYVELMDKNKIKRICKIYNGYVFPYLITVGYPNEDLAGPRKREIDDIIV